MPTSLVTGFQTLIFTQLFVLSSVNVGRSFVIAPANGCPPTRAVNCATFADVFTPLASGLAMIATAGLSSFSNTDHANAWPSPPGSRSTGPMAGVAPPVPAAEKLMSSK